VGDAQRIAQRTRLTLGNRDDEELVTLALAVGTGTTRKRTAIGHGGHLQVHDEGGREPRSLDLQVKQSLGLRMPPGAIALPVLWITVVIGCDPDWGWSNPP
jgi:hypothetical protein